MLHQLKQITQKKQRGAVMAEFVPIPMLLVGVAVLAILLIVNP